MGWTKTPSVDGYYWYTDKDVQTYTDCITVRVENKGNDKRVYFLSGRDFSLGQSFPYNQFDPYFYGPIPKPPAIVTPGSRYKDKERNYDPDETT